MEQNFQASQVEIDIDKTRSFISKVYLLIGFALLLTMATGYYIVNYQYDLLISIYNLGSIGFLGLIGVQLLLVSVITSKIRSENVSSGFLMTLFLIYSLSVGLVFSFYLELYDISTIMYAFGMTSVTFAGCGIVGYVIKKDLSGIARAAMFALIGIIVVSLFSLITGSYNDQFMLLMDYGIILIFAVLTAKDTQTMKNIANSDNAGFNGIMFCALNLYLDFINMFFAFIRIAGRK